MTGTLYIVATPIGNLEDITLRAAKVLSQVDVVLAEDTRVTRKLLDFVAQIQGGVNAQLKSYHAHSPEAKSAEILNLLVQGQNLALVTDAGTPGISDPGNELIAYLLEHEHSLQVIPVPGASAITAALSASGFRTGKFIFAGFLPKKGGTKFLAWLKDSGLTFAFYESPKRLVKTLTKLTDYFPDNQILVARELTKLHETLYRGKISQVLVSLPEKLKGEVVVVVEG